MKFKNLLLAGFVVSMAVACSSDAKTGKDGETMEEVVVEADPIIKTWALDNIDVSGAMEGLPKESFDQMKAMMDQMVAEQKGKMTFDIQEGGKVEVNSPDMEGNWSKHSGTWALSDDKKTLTLDIEGKKDDFVVEELTTDKLNIELEGQQMKMMFVPKK